VQTSLAFFCEFSAGLAAGFGFPVEGLGDWRWSAHVAERQNFDFEVSAFILDGQHVADAHLARRSRRLMIGFDPAELAGLCGECAGLEEARRPEPFVETHPYSLRQRRASGEAASGKTRRRQAVSEKRSGIFAAGDEWVR